MRALNDAYSYIMVFACELKMSRIRRKIKGCLYDIDSQKKKKQHFLEMFLTQGN